MKPNKTTSMYFDRLETSLRGAKEGTVWLWSVAQVGVDNFAKTKPKTLPLLRRSSCTRQSAPTPRCASDLWRRISTRRSTRTRVRSLQANLYATEHTDALAMLKKVVWSTVLPTVALAFGGASSDASSGPAAFDAYGSLSSGSLNCCAGQSLYLATNGWSGPDGVRLVKDAAGEWTGALAAMLKVLTKRMSMNLVFLEASDCEAGLSSGGGFAAVDLWQCKLKATGATVPVARFATFWQAPQWNTDTLDERYTTTSFLEMDTAALLHVRKKANFGLWQVLAPFSDELWLAFAATVIIGSVARIKPRSLETASCIHGSTHRLPMQLTPTRSTLCADPPRQ